MGIQQIKQGWVEDRLRAKAQDSSFALDTMNDSGSDDESLAMSMLESAPVKADNKLADSFNDKLNESINELQVMEDPELMSEEPQGGGRYIGGSMGENSGLSGGYWDKMSNIESGGDYNALNKGSGAHGRWQIMPATSKEYAKKLGLSPDVARSPAGQDAIIKRFTDDNANALRRAGLPVNDKTLYLAHQQGAGGAINLLKGRYDKVSDRNVNSNNPANVSKSQFANYWMNRMA